VPREAAEEAKEAVAAPAAAAAGGGDGLDMFADNIDADMFAEDPVAPVGIAPAKKALLDNYDDVEGYYNFQVAFCVASCVGLVLFAAPSAKALLLISAVLMHVVPLKIQKKTSSKVKLRLLKFAANGSGTSAVPSKFDAVCTLTQDQDRSHHLLLISLEQNMLLILLLLVTLKQKMFLILHCWWPSSERCF